jgi:hypothetical protein
MPHRYWISGEEKDIFSLSLYWVAYTESRESTQEYSLALAVPVVFVGAPLVERWRVGVGLLVTDRSAVSQLQQ